MKRSRYAFLLLILPFLIGQKSAQAQKGENTLLWKISGKGMTEASYLYGTMHVSDKRAFDWVERSMPYFKKCSQFAMELDPNKVDPAQMMQMMKLETGTLTDLYSREDYEKLHSHFMEEMHVDIKSFDQFKPFFLYSLIAQSQFGSDMSEAVDLYFNKQAVASGKTVHGLESLEEQMGAINSMSLEEQAEMLLMVATEKRKSDKSSKKLMKLYMKGDLQGMMEIAESSDEMGEDFEQEFLVTRNERMAERIPAILEKGPTFVAVGALHLPGDTGLINLLRKEGYTVEPIIP